MIHWPLLSLVTFLPLVGAALILMARGGDAVVARNARNIALWTSLIDLALSLVLWFEFDPSTADFQFVERANWVCSPSSPPGKQSNSASRNSWWPFSSSRR